MMGPKAYRFLPVALIITIGLHVRLPCPAQNSREPQYVGIPSASMNYFAASQQDSMWCWAASIQMVLNYYRVRIEQQQIVARTYGGHLPNQGADIYAMTANLNNWSIDNLGRYYIVMASVNFGAPTPAFLLAELSQQRPMIIGYRTGPQSSHAVVVTAASYTQSPYGPIIQSVVVRDPWPSPKNVQTRGRVEYPWASLANQINAHWYISVQ